MDSMVEMDSTICHQWINMADMDLHIMTGGGTVVNMTGMNAVGALEEGIGGLKNGTNFIMIDEGDGIIVDLCPKVMTEVEDTPGGVIPDRPAMIVEVDQKGIIVDAAVVFQGDGGLVQEVVHEVEDGVISRMVETEDVAARLYHVHGIEAQCRRTGVVHTEVTIIVINQRMMPTKMVRNKQINRLTMTRKNHRPTLRGKEVGSQTKESHRETNVVGPEVVVENAGRNTNDEMVRAKMIVTAEVGLENMEVHMKGIVVGVADIIVHERAIKSVAMILLQAPVWATTLIIHGIRGKRVGVSLRKNESAGVPNIMTHVVRRTNKLVKKEPKLKR